MPQRTLSEQEFTALRDRVLASAPQGMDEQGFNRWIGTAMDGAIAEAENLPATPEGSALGRFASNAGEMLNPVTIAQGIYGAVRHPVDTTINIGRAQFDQGRQAVDLARQGRYSEAIGHGVAAAVPILGPAAAEAGDQIGAGDWAGGAGKAFGVLAPSMVAPVARVVRRGAQVLPEAVAARAEAGAVSRVADVMAPKVGPNKTRFGNMAEDVAPAIAAELPKDARLWTREGLHSRVGTKLGEAEAALDAASDARLAARSHTTQPIIDALMEKRRRLTSEAVEASEYPRTPVQRASSVLDDRGQPITVTDYEVRPLGRDVVSGPDLERVAVIDRAIAELKQLGSVTRYDPIRTMRQAYDGPAKAVYSPSMTADYMKAQGGKLGAADVTDVLRRDALAKFDPPTAKANAQYHLWRTADDVLTAMQEVERTRPKVGRQIMARLTGATMGAQTAGAPGAIAGYIFAPAVDVAMSSGATTQLATARLLARLAESIRKGDVGHVASLTSQLRRMGVTAAAQTGRLTSPTGSLVPSEAGAR